MSASKPGATALPAGAAEHVRGVHGARGQRLLPALMPQLRGRERADERQAFAEGAAGIEVGCERNDAPGVDERPRRRHRPAEEQRARRQEHAVDVAPRQRRGRRRLPVASRWSTERAPSSIASGIAPRLGELVAVQAQREAGCPAGLEVAPRLRRVERSALEEDVGGLGEPRCLREHLREHEVEVGVRIVELGRHGVRAEPRRHAPAARIARSDASSVSRSRPYPDFPSNGRRPVPRASSRGARARRRARPSSPAARVARTVERIPPPAAWSSSYVAPRRAGRTPRPVAGEAGVRVAVDEPRDRAVPAAVELLDVAVERRQVTHAAHGCDPAVLAEHVRVLDHVDARRARGRAAARRPRRRRELGEIADEQPACRPGGSFLAVGGIGRRRAPARAPSGASS